MAASVLAGGPAFAAVAYVQGNNSHSQSAVSSVTVTYSSAQSAGDLNVVAVGWGNGSASVSSISDSSGNTYVLAVGPTQNGGKQSIYYATNIGAATAGSNTVTVTFSAATAWSDVRITEYSGMNTASPLDGTSGSTGTGTSMSSGSATTTNADDLLFAAAYIAGDTSTPGSSFTERMNPVGDLVEDRVVSATGSYSATADQTPSAGWIMQMAAFKAASGGGGGDTQAPSIPTGLTATVISSSQIDLSWSASSDNVGVTGYQLQRCQGAGCTGFADLATPSGTTFNDTGLSASTTYRYQVRARDAVPNWSLYSSIVSGTTQAPGDTVAPSAPTSLLIVAASSNEIDLVWTGSTDNVGVTAYVIERCVGVACVNFTQAGLVTTPVPPGTAFNNTGLSASTTYRYQVRARDAANNLSLPSNIREYLTPASSPDCN